MSPGKEFVAGIQAELPIITGVFPFGMIYGVLAIASGLPPALAQAMSAIVFAGSSQFVGTRLFAAMTPLSVIWLTTFVINLRHALYSASLAPYLRSLSWGWKWLLAYLLTDEAYAPTIVRYQTGEKSPYTHWFFLGAGLTLWASWQISTAIGIFVGAELPASWGLDFTLALTFIGLVVPALERMPAVAAALSAGIVALVAYDLPYQLGLMVAAVAGILVGVLAERNQ